MICAGAFFSLDLNKDSYGNISGMSPNEVFRQDEFMAAGMKVPQLVLGKQNDRDERVAPRHGPVNISVCIIQQTPFNNPLGCNINVSTVLVCTKHAATKKQQLQTQSLLNTIQLLELQHFATLPTPPRPPEKTVFS